MVISTLLSLSGVSGYHCSLLLFRNGLVSLRLSLAVVPNGRIYNVGPVVHSMLSSTC